MRLWFLLGLIAVALLLQATVFNFISIGGIKPELAMVLIILNGFLRGSREGAFLGFAGGIIQDLLYGGYVGIGALSQMTAGYLAGLAEPHLYKDKSVIVAGVTFLATVGGEICYWVLLLFAGVGVGFGTALLEVILPLALYNALLALLIYGRYYRSFRSGLLAEGVRQQFASR